jgi:alpha-glucosidase (family GH31 glycosyl hydrolase)
MSIHRLIWGNSLCSPPTAIVIITFFFCPNFLFLLEDLDRIIEELMAEDVRLMGYINPYLNTEGDMFQDAARMNYLLKDETGRVLIQDHAGFHAASIDFSNPDAFHWYSGEYNE